MKQRGSFSMVTAWVVALAGAFAISSAQAGEAGKAVVRSIRGHAQYAEGGNWLELKVGQTLKPGSTLRTANESQVDLFMDQNGPVVRLAENTTLGIDKLNFEATGIDTIIETQLDLKSGRILGIVKKMASTSKYEIKTPNGVAGIRGTEYVVTATSDVFVVTGSMVVVYVKADGTVVTQVVNAGECFHPSSGTVEPIPPDQLARLVAEVNDLRGAPTAELKVEEPIRIFVSPLSGDNSSIKQ
jgi:ferric-dicitrate binding protein FerR (iron transport regulator)